MISSQALWQHGSGELLVALALLLAVGRASPLRARAARLRLRPDRGEPSAGRADRRRVPALRRSGRRKRDAVWLLAGAALPLAALLYYNLGFIGHLAGGYAAAESQGKQFFDLDLLGLPGLLVSPTRGLLVFSPFLVFVFVGLAQRLRTPSSRRLAIALSVAVVSPALALLAGGLARRRVVGSAVARRPPADHGVDARARTASPASARTRTARRDDGGGGRRAGDRRLLVHEDERRAHLRGRPRLRCAPRGIRATRPSSPNCAIRPRPASFSAAPAGSSSGSERRCSTTTGPSSSCKPVRCSKDGRSPAGAPLRRCWC